MKKNLFKKRILFCFVICSVLINSNFVRALNKADSLKIELGKVKEDTVKVKLLNLLACELINSEPEISIGYTEEALNLALKLNDKKQTAVAYSCLAIFKESKGDFRSAMDYYKRTLDICRQVKDTIQIANALNNIAVLYNLQSDWQSALNIYYEILKFPGLKKNKRMYAKTIGHLADIYTDQKNYKEALRLQMECLDIDISIKNMRGVTSDYFGIADIYAKQNDFENALKYNLKSLETATSNNNKRMILMNQNYIGMNYFGLKKYKEACGYLTKGLEMAQSSGDEYNIAQILCNLGSCYLQLKETAKGIEMIKQSLVLSQQLEIKDMISTNYHSLADGYETKGDYKEALKFHKLYSELNDSIYNEENTTQINELSTKYQSEKKGKEIALLNLELLTKQKDQELLRAQIQKRNSIIYGTAGGAVLLILSVILLFNRRQLIQRNKYQTEISKQRENAAAAVVQAQENERGRIAKDLHDSIGTFLSTLKINLQLYEGSIPKEKSEGFQNALNLIDNISIELRNIMKNLSNETLQEFGLVHAFEELVDRINGLGKTHFDFHTHGISKRQSDIIELNLYRVAQELLNNCIKYAQASNATLQLIADENNTTLMLEDNGIGFDPKTKNKNHGMGIKNIYDRINFIKGTVRIESGPVNGTLFVIDIPKN